MKSSLASRVLVACSGQPETTDRSWLMAEALSSRHDVILAVPAVTGLSHRKFAVVYYNARNLWLIARDSDVVVCDPAVLAAQPQLLKAGKPVAVDLGASADDGGMATVLGSGDFFISSSEEERGLWLDGLERAGRLNRFTADGDPGYRRLLGVGGPDSIGELADYCVVPRFAPDRGSGLSLAGLPEQEDRSKGPLHYWRALMYLLRNGGPGAVWARGSLAIKRKISRRQIK